MSLRIDEKDQVLDNVFQELKKINKYFDVKMCRKGSTEGPNKDCCWRSIYLSETKDTPWVAFCWSEYFESSFPEEETPFWIEIDKAPSKAFFDIGLNIICNYYPQPDIEKERIVIPVSVEGTKISEKVASIVMLLAEALLNNR